MAQPAYRGQLTDPRYPEVASTFLCGAILLEAIDLTTHAGWGYIHAAWVLDDVEENDLAVFSRSKAADLFIQGLSVGHRLSDQVGASEAIIVDCLRRAERFGDARAMVTNGLTLEAAEIIQKVLLFQRSLIERSDTSAHLLDEALEYQ